MHDRTGTITDHVNGYPVVTFDDPTKCCDDPRCAATPSESRELILRLDLPKGTRVRTWWERGVTYGGVVARRIEEEKE